MSKNQPSFSIVIPTYNRPNRLMRCLAAMVELDYARDKFEVIVVDDGSKRPLDSLVAPFAKQIQLCLVRQPNQGPATARNAGAAMAKGEYLAFTDDDCMPSKDWLNQLANQYMITPYAVIGGHTVNILTHNHYSAASQQLIDYLYQYYNQLHPIFFASNNISVPQKLFLAMDGFASSMPLAAGEDREFCNRWRHDGHLLVYEPNAIINHAHQLTAVSFWRQHFNYGRGSWQYHQIRAKRSKEALRLEPPSFYWNLLLFPLRQRQFPYSLWHAVLITVSQLANAVGFFSEAKKNSSSGNY